MTTNLCDDMGGIVERRKEGEYDIEISLFI
jgi:hypothetical protein